jgi:hypothetical protein
MELSKRQKKWFWMMDYCKANKLHPGERESWEEAKEAWRKHELKSIEFKSLNKGMKVKFKGEIAYGQDMSFHKNDFGDKEFTFVEKTSNDLMIFEAPGYGVPDDYGNGKIYVSSKYIYKLIRVK